MDIEGIVKAARRLNSTFTYLLIGTTYPHGLIDVDSLGIMELLHLISFMAYAV